MNLLSVSNPADDSLIERLPIDEPARVAQRVAEARRAQGPWALRPLSERAQIIAGFAQSVRAQLPALAQVLTRETGKPLAHSSATIWCLHPSLTT